MSGYDDEQYYLEQYKDEYVYDDCYILGDRPSTSNSNDYPISVAVPVEEAAPNSSPNGPSTSLRSSSADVALSLRGRSYIVDDASSNSRFDGLYTPSHSSADAASSHGGTPYIVQDDVPASFVNGPFTLSQSSADAAFSLGGQRYIVEHDDSSSSCSMYCNPPSTRSTDTVTAEQFDMPYAFAGSGTNPPGNHMCTHDYSPTARNPNAMHYPECPFLPDHDGSTYFSNGRCEAWYTPLPPETAPDAGNGGLGGQEQLRMFKREG